MLGRISLVAILCAYWVAGAICARYPFDGSVALPPMMLLIACGVWSVWQRRSPVVRPLPSRWFLALVLLFAAAIPLVTLAAGPPVSRTAPSPTETLVLVALVPAAEELLFRGLLLSELLRHLRAPLAVVLVSALFATCHAGPSRVIMFVLSLTWSSAVLSSRSVLAAIVLHAMWNAWFVIHTMADPTGRMAWAVFVSGIACAGALLLPRRSTVEG